MREGAIARVVMFIASIVVGVSEVRMRCFLMLGYLLVAISLGSGCTSSPEKPDDRAREEEATLAAVRQLVEDPPGVCCEIHGVASISVAPQEKELVLNLIKELLRHLEGTKCPSPHAAGAKADLFLYLRPCEGRRPDGERVIVHIYDYLDIFELSVPHDGAAVTLSYKLVPEKREAVTAFLTQLKELRADDPESQAGMKCPGPTARE